MSQRVRAVFRHGVFELKEPCDFPEELEVELVIEAPGIEAPRVKDPSQRARLRQELVESVRRNPFPGDRPDWTRDELHERR
jgi:predicted DNA-binding antitoxin AbrB/MazE fold protein